MNWLQRKVRAWLGITDAAPVTTDEAPRAGMQIRLSDVMRASIDQPKKGFKRPDVMKGVIPDNPELITPLPGEAPYMALDDANSAPFYAYANQFAALGAGIGFQGYTFLSELSQISEYRAPAEVISTEMTRKWIKLKNIGKADKTEKIAEIEKAMRDFNLQEHFRKASLQGEFFGCGHLQILVDGQDEERDLPLVIDSAGIPKGKLQGFKNIEPYWCTPYSYNSLDPAKPYFYQPESWFVVGRKTHSSRLMTFIPREVPDLLKPPYNFGGISLTQLMEPDVNEWLRTRRSVSDLIHSFSVSTLMTDMQGTLQSDGTVNGDAIFNRAQFFNNMRDNRGLMVIDKATEDIKVVTTPLSGLDELQAQAQEHMCAPSHLPLVKMFGLSPSGLNATGESELQVMNDFVKSKQENDFTKHLTTCLKAVQLHLYGDVDEDIAFEYVPLVEMTQKELSEIRKSDADAGQGYINAQVITPEEERERLQSDPNSGYNNLNGPAPEPEPEPDELGAAGEESNDPVERAAA
jgi:phage-related protein (TIGR01555 family)